MQLKDWKNLTRDDVLAELGLETRRAPADYLVPVLGIFGAGVLVGAGLGLLFAPKQGRELRQDIGRRIPQIRGRGAAEKEEAATSQVVGAR